jgi:hypothetical protein
LPLVTCAGIRDAPGARIMAAAHWHVCGLMLSIARLPVRRQVSEVLNAKIWLQIENVYAGLKGTILALWHHPSALVNVFSKSPAIAISRFGFGDMFLFDQTWSVALDEACCSLDYARTPLKSRVSEGMTCDRNITRQDKL